VDNAHRSAVKNGRHHHNVCCKAYCFYSDKQLARPLAIMAPTRLINFEKELRSKWGEVFHSGQKPIKKLNTFKIFKSLR